MVRFFFVLVGYSSLKFFALSVMFGSLLGFLFLRYFLVVGLALLFSRSFSVASLARFLSCENFVSCLRLFSLIRKSHSMLDLSSHVLL